MSEYWKVFRIIFTVFSLYIMGASFYCWDGFAYYGSLSDFLPGVAIILILSIVVAVILTLFILLPFKILQWSWLRTGWEINIEHLLMFISITILGGVLIWKCKLFIEHYIVFTMQTTLIILLAATISILLTTILRNKAVIWIGMIQERITPIVWLFGILVVLSIPLVTYHALGKKEKNLSSKISQTSITNKDKPNIILVTFDALTVCNMSAYKYDRETTPFIKEWAKNASIFTMAEAESNYTSPTIASLMTGKRVWTHQLYASHGYSIVKADTENLPLILKNNGYYNIAFVQNNFASTETLGISDSFKIAPLAFEVMAPASIERFFEKQFYLLFGNNYHRYNWFFRNDFLVGLLINIVPQEISETEYPPEKVFNKFLKIIDNDLPTPFFAWIHVFPPHAPYLPPEPYMGMIDSSPKLRTSKSQLRIWENVDIDTKRARYDEFIKYCDKEFENFIKELTKYKYINNTVIILSADHGQSFEHNYITHGGPHLYEQLTNIPLIIREPGQTERRIINNVVEQIDIAPTILELANISTPVWMEGRSLVPLMRGRGLESKPALSMMLESTPKGQKIIDGTFAIWEGDFKLIHYLKDNKSLLFNLKQDFGELDNLCDREPEISQHLLTLIKENLKKANEKIIN